MPIPRLRALDAFPVQEDGKTYLALRDNEGFTDKLILLPLVDAMAAARLDGERGEEEVAAELERQLGPGAYPRGRVRELARTLDENMMLESPRFREHERRTLEAYRGAPERAPFLAGRSYEADPKRLARSIAGFFSAAGAPGAEPEKDGEAPLTGLVAPHIDFQRGRTGYAWAYGEVLRSGLADLYVILGVAHSPVPVPIVLTEKDFGTPLGAAPVDRELARALAEKAPYEMTAGELAHRSEHSIEFQTVMLRYAQERLGGSFRILPLLCSSWEPDGSVPARRADEALDRLAGLLEGYPGRVCVLAGADLAHVGPRFGDAEAVTPERLEQVRREDEAGLERVLAGDARGFLDSVMSDGNSRRVCGAGALYSFSFLHRRLFPRSSGRLLHYANAADPAGGEVTFASLAFR